ncbi:Uncharacterised protein [Mycobacteroides abscessus subsp. abscessus]|uniref:hypothetical protein n=1 Tax=Mycobacteroides abscessus TaxID=36809 RepID=UPI00092AF3F9|nr:hypothetical protein [Mycobacteroides abscessus]MBE5513781.1 hypothetical protein [Mycobacteroides abscessus]MBN7327673.1 hypothetical protein [Mycobacteroides abscessus subsp. abscessus]SID61643.1 Uncharacterised protein [Mycobacteroides abscessus subsp. abscessus]SIE84033.1 Uncharacterised protein [Mycobacteroides abscessus subsp. abscessus]SIF72004.1 Uncharacterised protein [Mycobacteroides abscessus subsp. abscessus]
MNDTIYAALSGLVDAETTDAELELITATATAVAAPQLASDLRAVRDRARAAVRPKSLTDEQLLIQSVLDLGIAELITHATSDAEIDALVIAAEAGAGGPIPGLREELHLLRDAEAAEHRSRGSYTRIDSRDPFCPTALRETERRVFVGGAFGDPIRVQVPDPAPRIANVGETDEFVQPGESSCRHAYRG